MRVLVAGANGNTGTRIVRLLAAGPHQPVALIREADQKPKFDAMEVETVVADLEESLDRAVEGCDAVVFAAGSGSATGPEKTVDVDQEGAIRLVDTCAEHGVGRFVMLSTMGADPESEGHAISHYFRAKGVADEHLRGSDLDYTIVRPGRLTDDPGRGTVSAGDLERGGEIPRDDVAAFIVACLDHDNTIGATVDVLEGDTPIRDAVAGV